MAIAGATSVKQPATPSSLKVKDSYIIDGLHKHINLMVQHFRPKARLEIFRHSTGRFVISDQNERNLKEFERCTYRPSHIKMPVTGSNRELHRLEGIRRRVIREAEALYPHLRVYISFVWRYACIKNDEEFNALLVTIRLNSR